MRTLTFVVVLASLVVAPVGLGAQSYTVIAEWDPNPVAENVTQYRVQVDSTVYYVQAGSCTTVCAQPIAVGSGAHTIIVAAENSFGWGPDASITFSLSVPGKSTNIRIRIP